MNPDVIILKARDDSFSVKDKRYTKKVESHGKYSPMLALVKMYAGNYFRNELTNDDDWVIINEFRLIQDKKSNLSKSSRDKMEGEFNNRFVETK